MAGEGAVAGDGVPGKVAGEARPTAPIARALVRAHSSSAPLPFFSFSVLRKFSYFIAVRTKAFFSLLSRCGFKAKGQSLCVVCLLGENY